MRPHWREYKREYLSGYFLGLCFFRFPINQAGEGNGNPLQYSCLENPMDGGAWWATVHGVTKSRTQLSDFTFTFHFHALKKERATHSSVLAWRIPGMGSLVSCRLWGHTELDTTEMTQQQQSSMATLSPPLKVPDIQHSLVVPKQGCSLEPPMVFF